MDWLPCIVVLLAVQRFDIPSQDLGTLHSVWFPFGDESDAHAAWEACKRRAGWQPCLHRPQSWVAAWQGLLLNQHSGNADAPLSAIALTPAALAEAAAASVASLTKAGAASGARQPAEQGSQRSKAASGATHRFANGGSTPGFG